MAYETKVILKMVVKLIAKAETVEDAYNAIAESAKDIDVELPAYEEARKGNAKS